MTSEMNRFSRGRPALDGLGLLGVRPIPVGPGAALGALMVLGGAAYVTAVFTAIPAIGAAVVVGLTVAG